MSQRKRGYAFNVEDVYVGGYGSPENPHEVRVTLKPKDMGVTSLYGRSLQIGLTPDAARALAAQLTEAANDVNFKVERGR